MAPAASDGGLSRGALRAGALDVSRVGSYGHMSRLNMSPIAIERVETIVALAHRWRNACDRLSMLIWSARRYQFRDGDDDAVEYWTIEAKRAYDALERMIQRANHAD